VKGRRGGQGYSQRILRSAPVALKRVERLRHSGQRALSAPSIGTPLIKGQSPVRPPELQRSWLYTEGRQPQKVPGFPLGGIPPPAPNHKRHPDGSTRRDFLDSLPHLVISLHEEKVCLYLDDEVLAHLIIGEADTLAYFVERALEGVRSDAGRGHASEGL